MIKVFLGFVLYMMPHAECGDVEIVQLGKKQQDTANAGAQLLDHLAHIVYVLPKRHDEQGVTDVDEIVAQQQYAIDRLYELLVVVKLHGPCLAVLITQPAYPDGDVHHDGQINKVADDVEVGIHSISSYTFSIL